MVKIYINILFSLSDEIFDRFFKLSIKGSNILFRSISLIYLVMYSCLEYQFKKWMTNYAMCPKSLPKKLLIKILLQKIFKIIQLTEY